MNELSASADSARAAAPPHGPGVRGLRPRRFIDYYIRPARPEDVKNLAPRLREADRREIWALGRLTPEEALGRSLEISVKARVALTGGRVILMWGVARRGGLLGFTGTPWLLGSDILERPEVSREFIRQSKPYARELEEGFNRLENWAHGENRLALRWLKWLGFSFAERPTPWNGEYFYRFWRDCHV
jgi:hypothetical protein